MSVSSHFSTEVADTAARVPSELAETTGSAPSPATQHRLAARWQPPTVILIEPDSTDGAPLAAALQAEGLGVLIAADIVAARAVSQHPLPGVVALWHLPEDTGRVEDTALDPCRWLCGHSRVPVIVATTAAQAESRIEALDAGAAAVLTWPVSAREMAARIRAVLRHSLSSPVPGSTEDPVVEAAGVRIDPARHLAQVDGQSLELSRKEFQLLTVLVERAGHLLTRDHLITTVWDHHDRVGSKTLDVHIKRLRDKIEPDRHNPTRIRTVRGIGYRFGSE